MSKWKTWREDVPQGEGIVQNMQRTRDDALDLLEEGKRVVCGEYHDGRAMAQAQWNMQVRDFLAKYRAEPTEMGYRLINPKGEVVYDTLRDNPKYRAEVTTEHTVAELGRTRHTRNDHHRKIDELVRSVNLLWEKVK